VVDLLNLRLIKPLPARWHDEMIQTNADAYENPERNYSDCPDYRFVERFPEPIASNILSLLEPPLLTARIGIFTNSICRFWNDYMRRARACLVIDRQDVCSVLL
jgi:hypothetical protein